MEVLSTRPVTPDQVQSFRIRMLVNALAIVPLALSGPGCTTTGPFVAGKVSEPPTGVPCRVVVTWLPEVRLNSDPTHGGAPTPGIAGRVFLFGEEIGAPFIAAGAVVVDLFDKTAGKNSPLPLQRW